MWRDVSPSAPRMTKCLEMLINGKGQDLNLYNNHTAQCFGR